jgi:hypothetical protein
MAWETKLVWLIFFIKKSSQNPKEIIHNLDKVSSIHTSRGTLVGDWTRLDQDGFILMNEHGNW